MIIGINGREIGAGRSLADMRTEWAPCLVRLDVRAGVRKIEIVVALGIICKGGIVKHGSKIDRGTLAVEKSYYMV